MSAVVRGDRHLTSALVSLDPVNRSRRATKWCCTYHHTDKTMTCRA